jgi:hypothetical protein
MHYRKYLLFLLVFVFLPGAGSGQDIDGEGKITFIQGNCFVQREGIRYREASLNQVIYTSDTIKTEKNSGVEVTLNDNTVIFIEEDTEINLFLSAIQEKRFTNIGILFGRIKLFVAKLSPENESFAINTVSVTAGIRGSELDVSVREDGAVLINVEEGSVDTFYNYSKGGIQQGNASVFYADGEREDFNRRVEPGIWKQEAIRRISENPGAVLKKLLERQKRIIQRLKENQREMEVYKRQWASFLNKRRSLASAGRYEDEKQLIQKQIKHTRSGVIYLTRVRRNLTIIRSIVVLAYRIEQNLDADTVKSLPELDRLRAEYKKLSTAIKKIESAERQLRRVLRVLNMRYYELNQLTFTLSKGQSLFPS